MPLSRKGKLAIGLLALGGGALLYLLHRQQAPVFFGGYVGNGQPSNKTAIPFAPEYITVEFGANPNVNPGLGHDATVYFTSGGVFGVTSNQGGSSIQTGASLTTFYSNGQLDIGALQAFFNTIQTPSPFALNDAGIAYAFVAVGPS